MIQRSLNIPPSYASIMHCLDLSAQPPQSHSEWASQICAALRRRLEEGGASQKELKRCCKWFSEAPRITPRHFKHEFLISHSSEILKVFEEPSYTFPAWYGLQSGTPVSSCLAASMISENILKKKHVTWGFSRIPSRRRVPCTWFHHLPLEIVKQCLSYSSCWSMVMP